jgi:uncharacterized iron-regulated membrane protein
VKENRKKLKYWIGKLHLWLGLTSGLVVFIVAVTGCLYAFQAEIQDFTQSYRHVEKRDEAFLPPSQLRSVAERELPGKNVHAVQYETNERAAYVIFYGDNPPYYYAVFINPYTGKLLKVKDFSSDFFRIVLMGHYYLWLPPGIGQPLVAVATLVFVVMLISGIVLWWPKRGKEKQRFRIKFDARWRRKNYDLHNILGFYVSWLALILALTGLVWGFQWFSKSIYWLASGGKTAVVYEEPTSNKKNISAAETQPVDRLWKKLKKENPTAQGIEVHFPESDSSSISASINPDRSTYWKTDYRYFDQYTLNEIEVNQIYGKLSNATAADKLVRMNYDIHTGAVLGLTGKVLAFFGSLLVASLPITGFYIWWGRRNKEKHPQVKKKYAPTAKA